MKGACLPWSKLPKGLPARTCRLNSKFVDVTQTPSHTRQKHSLPASVQAVCAASTEVLLKLGGISPLSVWSGLV